MKEFKDKFGKRITVGDRILSHRDGRIDDLVIKTIKYLPESDNNDEGFIINKEKESDDLCGFHFADSIIKQEKSFDNKARNFIINYLKQNSYESIGHLQMKLNEQGLDLRRSEIKSICEQQMEKGNIVRGNFSEEPERYAHRKNK